MEDTVYLIPGRGNTLHDIGQLLLSLDREVCGRELLPPFSGLFSRQLHIIQQDLGSFFWHATARLIGHSYGAYLLLHALSELEPFPGRILLFSPVLGPTIDSQRLFISRPPRADKLLTLAKTGSFPSPQYLEIHTGEEDKGCSPGLAQEFADLISSAEVFIIPNKGHNLPSPYLQRTISSFCLSSSKNLQ